MPKRRKAKGKITQYKKTQSYHWVIVSIVLTVGSLILINFYVNYWNKSIPFQQVTLAKNTKLGHEWKTGELVVEFHPGVSQSNINQLVSSHGSSVKKEIKKISTVVLQVPEQAVEGVENALSHNPFVSRVSKNFIYEEMMISPNDPGYKDQWALRKIGLPTAWEQSKGSENQIIAILDSGIDTDHPDFAGRLLPGWDYTDDNSDYEDLACGHGTKVAGIVGAVTNNNLAIAGVTWNTKILPVKIAIQIGEICAASLADIAEGLVGAADKGAKIANISYKINNGVSLTTSLSYFQSKGGLVFAAGGNADLTNPDQFLDLPENPYLISVAMTDSRDDSFLSVAGPYIDLSAPGHKIPSLTNGGFYDPLGGGTGTSYASPIAAGVAALVWSHSPHLSPYQVEAILETTAVDRGVKGYDPDYGWGRVDAQAAIAKANTITQADQNAPTVTITNPPNGSTVSGDISIDVSAVDDNSMGRVDLIVDNRWYASDFIAPYKFIVSSSTLSAGSHTFVAEAYDMSLNKATSSTIQVSVEQSTTNPSPTPRRGKK